MSLVKSQRKRNAGHQARNNQVVRMAVPANLRPPTFLPNPAFSRKIRFACNASGGYNVTPKAIGNAIGVMCTSSTSASTLVTAFKIKRIQIWGVSGTSNQTISLTWFGDQTLNFESNKEFSDSSTSTAYVPYLNLVPPNHSSARDWQAVGGSFSTGVIFALNCGNGSIIDLTLDVIVGDGNASPTAATAITGGTAGVIKYGPLDGYGGGSLPATSVTSM